MDHKYIHRYKKWTRRLFMKINLSVLPIFHNGQNEHKGSANKNEYHFRN